MLLLPHRLDERMLLFRTFGRMANQDAVRARAFPPA
jgi:hypothetical protein